jgi:cytoskeletal protein CcmA (bactofilin family)
VAADHIISAGTRIKGTVSGHGVLVVAGTIEGKVQLDGSLEVAPGGRVAAEVSATDVVVSGQLSGRVQATGSVTLTERAVVEADIRASRIAIDPRARLVGELVMPLELPRGRY